MSLLRNHLVLMFIYAVATGIYFALLWKTTRPERIRFFLKVFVGLTTGVLLYSYLLLCGRPSPLKKGALLQLQVPLHESGR